MSSCMKLCICAWCMMLCIAIGLEVYKNGIPTMKLQEGGDEQANILAAQAILEDLNNTK